MCAWYDPDWRFRAPIAVNNIGGASTIDVSAVIPGGHDLFWDNVLVTGNDIRVTQSDGSSLVTYQITGWNHGNKAGTVEIAGLTPGSDDATCMVFLYWGKAGAASAGGSFTASSAKTGNFEFAIPTGIVVDGRREKPGVTTPSQVISKSPNEEVHVYVDVTPLLAIRTSPSQGSSLYEEIKFSQVQVTDAGTPQGGMIDEGLTRFLEHGTRRYIRVHIKAGSDTGIYTLEVKFKTSKGQTIELRYLLKVDAPDD